MPTRELKARTLSIFLLKNEIVPPENALVNEGDLAGYPLVIGTESRGTLYIKPTSDKMPSWLSMFEGAISPAPVGIHNASSAAVLIIATGGRNFALTFGYGKSLMRPGSWEEDFGLRVTLNAVDPLKIRSVDRVKFDAIAQHSQIQASRDANILEFGLDVEQDLLRAVTGKPRDASLASQLTGKDALKADVPISLLGIPGLLRRFLEIFGQEIYKEHFSWVDQVNELRDPVETERLNAILIEKLTHQDFERLWLAIPDRVEWEAVSGFKYRQTRHAGLYSDVHFKTFLEEAGEHFVPTVDILKQKKRVYLMSYENDLPVASWSLYRCIYCEIDSDEQTFLLNNGKWYRVREDFLRAVNDSFVEVSAGTLRLPDYSHGTEEAYNRFVAEGAPETYTLMDRNVIRYPATRDQIEFCDLYSVSKLIIHVKKYRGSATLSHLFSQGLVSAELFCSLSDFRRAVYEHLSGPFALGDADVRPGNDEFEVVFAIISESTSPLTLPFFSRVNLRNTAQRLRAFGYKASVVKIQSVRPQAQ
jgi:uncharacterized protein (TIGR04141 family)